MTEVLEETEYRQVGFPGSFPNWRSLLGVIPACLFFSLAYASSFNQIWWRDYAPLGFIWLACGLAMVVVSIGGIRGVKVAEKSTETTLIMFSWACADALLGLAFIAGRHLPANEWLGLGYVLITVLLMNLGTMFVVWDTLTGIFGAFAKAMTVAMGAASMGAAVIATIIVATTSIVT